MNDLPNEFVDRLTPEIVALWKARGDTVPNLVLRPTDRDGLEYRLDDATLQQPAVLRGPAAQLLAWASGRPWDGLECDREVTPVAPRWL